MCFKNTLNSYGVVAKGLHWVMGLLIIGLLAIGLLLESFENTPTFMTLINLHKEFGIIVLTLAVLRLGWKVLDVSPSLPAHMGCVAKMMAKIGHFGLYVLMFAMPISGWMTSSAAGYPVSMFGLFELPMLTAKDKDFAHDMGELHETFAWVLMGLLAVHILAALVHHFYYKDDILRRMLPNCKKSEIKNSDISTGC
jgi:cytochrome b561